MIGGNYLEDTVGEDSVVMVNQLQSQPGNHAL